MLDLTHEDAAEIFNSLADKLHSVKDGKYGHDEMTEKWKLHLGAIMEKIGDDGENLNEEGKMVLPNSDLKTYHFHLTEFNGEREYGEDYLVYAENQEDAENQARECARNYRDNGVVVDEFDKNRFEFDCGQFAVEVSSVNEMPKEDFVELLLTGTILNQPE